jgi:hypothetical protein
MARVRVLLDGTVDAVIPFVVADVTRPIVSLGKLTKRISASTSSKPLAVRRQKASLIA